MKTTELQELFADAKTAQDLIAIFEAHPGLEDEILELGKKQGINLDEPRELTDLELELVAGGLNLKKGVMITMSTLMLAGCLTVPLSQATKAHAAVEKGPKTEQFDNDIKNIEESKEGISVNNNDNGLPGEGGMKNNDVLTENPALNKKYNEIKGINYGQPFTDAGTAASTKFVEGLAKNIKIPVVGDMIGSAASTLLKGLFNLGPGKDENAEIKNLILDCYKALHGDAQRLLKATNESTFDIKQFVDMKLWGTEAKIDAIGYNKAITRFNTCMGDIAAILNHDSLRNAFEKLNSNEDNPYEANKGTIDSAFEKAYNAKDAQGETIFRAFKSVSDFFVGTNLPDVQKANGQLEKGIHLNIMELKRLSLVGENKRYHFDNESINERFDFLKTISKQYISEYYHVKSLISVEHNKCVYNYQKEYCETAKMLGIDINELNGYKNSNPNLFKKYDSQIRNNTKDDTGQNVQSISAKYDSRIADSAQHLREIDQLYNNTINQLKREYAKIKFESENMHIFSAHNKAYTIGQIIDTDSRATKLGGLNCTSTDSWEKIGGSITKFNVRCKPKWEEHIATRKFGVSVMSWRSMLENLEKTEITPKIAKERFRNRPMNNNYKKSKFRGSGTRELEAAKVFEEVKYTSDCLEEWGKRFSDQLNTTKESNAADILGQNNRWLTQRLYTAYKNVNFKGKQQMDGILIGEGRVNCEGYKYMQAEFFHKRYFYNKNKSFDVNATSKFKIRSWYRYINDKTNANGAEVSQWRRIDFETGTNHLVQKHNMKLGMIKDVTGDYYSRLKAAMDVAAPDPMKAIK